MGKKKKKVTRTNCNCISVVFAGTGKEYRNLKQGCLSRDSE